MANRYVIENLAAEPGHIDETDSHIWSLIRQGIEVEIKPLGRVLRKGDENSILLRIELLFAISKAKTS